MTSATSGPMSRTPFVFFDQDESCWRTSQATFLLDLDRYSETWPPSGMTRSGSAYELPTWAPRIVASEFSSLLPTPVATTSGSRTEEGIERRRQSPWGGSDLLTVLHPESLLPTPRARAESRQSTVPSAWANDTLLDVFWKGRPLYQGGQGPTLWSGDHTSPQSDGGNSSSDDPPHTPPSEDEPERLD